MTKHPIEQSFLKNQKENPLHSSYVNFRRAIDGRNFSQSIVFTYFKKLVDKSDYDLHDREELLTRNIYPLLKSHRAQKNP